MCQALFNWYAVLQLDRCSDGPDFIKEYCRLALLHPDKNKFPFADAMIRLVVEYFRFALLHLDKNKFPFADFTICFVVDSWAVLFDWRRKSLYNNELGMFEKVNLVGSRSDGDRA